MPRRICLVTADSDPEGRWIEIEANSVFEAACHYESYCCAPKMGCNLRRDRGTERS